MKYTKNITVGYDADGKRIRKRFYADTKADLEKKIRAFWIEKEKVKNPSAVTLKSYADTWLETYKAGKSPGTYSFYKIIVKKLNYFGSKELRHVTRSDCQGLINKNWEHPHSAKQIRLVLNQVFNCAIDDGIISVNPARNLELPKIQPSERKSLSESELEAVRKAVLPDNEKLFVQLLLVFGLRPGEALALQRRNFNFGSMELTIDHSVAHGDNNPVYKETKTGTTRVIPIPEQLRKPLKAYLRKHKTLFLFCMEDGSMLSKSALATMRRHIQAATGVDDLYTFRHHRATELYYLYQKGVISTKKAAYLMGHSEEIFLKIYSHIDDQKEQTEKLYEGLVI